MYFLHRYSSILTALTFPKTLSMFRQNKIIKNKQSSLYVHKLHDMSLSFELIFTMLLYSD